MQEREEATRPGGLRKRFADRVIPIAFCLSVVGISGVGFLAYHLLDKTQESEAWVLHTTVAISRLEALHRTLVEAESAGRGFLVSGDERFRESFVRSSAVIDDELHAFKNFTTYNAVQQRLAAELNQHIGRRFAFLESLIGLRASGGPEALQTSKIGAVPPRCSSSPQSSVK